MSGSNPFFKPAPLMPNKQHTSILSFNVVNLIGVIVWRLHNELNKPEYNFDIKYNPNIYTWKCINNNTKIIINIFKCQEKHIIQLRFLPDNVFKLDEFKLLYNNLVILKNYINIKHAFKDQ